MIKPTMKERRRYVKVRFEGEEVSEREAREAVDNAVLSFLGELGFSKANPRLVEFKNNEAVILCSHSEVQKVKAALALVDRIKGKPGCIRILRVSGMRSRM
ncbi:MAG: Rpp14/Pop5 family protein [Candidatus Micrarchaeia archaeon]